MNGKPLVEDIDFDSLARMTEGYSGADLKQVCLKASLIPFRDAISTGTDRNIEMADIKGVLEAVRPSIEKKVLIKYERFRSGK